MVTQYTHLPTTSLISLFTGKGSSKANLGELITVITLPLILHMNLMVCRTMFWRTDHTIFDIEGALHRSQEALQTALTRNLPESDIRLVQDSIRVQCVLHCALLAALAWLILSLAIGARP